MILLESTMASIQYKTTLQISLVNIYFTWEMLRGGSARVQTNMNYPAQYELLAEQVFIRKQIINLDMKQIL